MFLTKIHIKILLLILLSCRCYSQYDSNLISFISDEFKGIKLTSVLIKKDFNVKLKYFAAKQGEASVYERFTSWRKGKNILVYSSGTYMSDCDAKSAVPVGICIDEGRMLNNVISHNFDGFCIIQNENLYVNNLEDNDFTIIYPNGERRGINIKDKIDVSIMLDWATKSKSTFFQTHLLAYRNELKIKPELSSDKLSNRRFIVSGNDHENKTIHIIFSIVNNLSLYESSILAFNYLRSNNILKDITFIINVDPGCQDVYQVFNSDGSIKRILGFIGTFDISASANLLVYYTEN